MPTMFEELSSIGMTKHYDQDYAIEVEAEFKKEFSSKVNGFSFKHDGSLSPLGIEFISRGPSSLKDINQNVKQLLELPEFKEDYIFSERTSTHVHVNIQNWTHEELFTVLITYYLIEGFVYSIVGDKRQNNLFCLAMYEANNIVDILKVLYSKDYRRLSSLFERYKYSGLNIASVARLGTIEFRHMYGTNNYKEIKNWINLIDKICKSRFKFRNMNEVYNAYCENREAFLLHVLEDLCPKYINNDLFEMNWSSVAEFLCNKNQYKNKNKKVYSFKSEVEEDNWMGF